MTSFRRVAIASFIATCGLVAIGGLVRATKSGLGCGDDWPDCGGRLIPTLATRAEIIEFSHRAAAGIVVLLLAGLALLAVTRYRSSSNLMWASVAAFGTVIFQALLGAAVVIFDLRASLVVVHLATAMALLALLVYIVTTAARQEGAIPSSSHRATSRRAALAAGSVFLLLLAGSYVTGQGAGNVFPDWPLMGGRLVPDLSVEPFAIHWIHRVLAVVTGIIVFLVGAGVVRRGNELPGAVALARVAMSLYVVEVIIGAINVWSNLNSIAVTLHLTLGALIWTCFVGIAVVAHPVATTARAGSPSRVAPALEGGR